MECPEAREKARGGAEPRRLAAPFSPRDEPRKHGRAAPRDGPFGGAMSTQPHASSESTEGRRKAGKRTTRTPGKSRNGSGAERLSLIGVKVDKALRAEIDEYAKTRTRSTSPSIPGSAMPWTSAPGLQGGGR